MTNRDERAASKSARERAPSFFIVGQPKAGTTALYNALKRHPEIHMPVKEPRFFEDRLGAPPARRPPGAGRTPRTLEDYLALFDGAKPGQRVGEASPSYLFSPFAASRIAEIQPAARIITILREPASFLRSLHLQLLQIHAENETDLRKAIAYESERREGRRLPPQRYWVDTLQYSRHIEYVEQLRRFQSRFSPEQVLVLIYDDFRSDNEGTVRRVLRFLDVDEDHPIAVKKDSNPTVSVRAQRVHDLIHAVAAGDGPLSRGVTRTAKALAPRGITRQSALAIRDRLFYAKPKDPDESLTRELRVRFRPEVQALSEYLDRDLIRLWGYEEID